MLRYDKKNYSNRVRGYAWLWERLTIHKTIAMKNYLLNYRVQDKLWYITVQAKDIFNATELLNKEVDWAVVTYVYCEDTVVTVNRDLFPN